jgi:hypothetical protein
MKDLNRAVFVTLFKEACEKCFGFPLTSPLSEADSKLLSNKILEKTGLVIGAKSIKNYSHYVLHDSQTKKENPSDATLDTLARYVLGAPYTNEVQRKDKENHYPYWFLYRSRFSAAKPNLITHFGNLKMGAIILSIVSALAIGLYLVKYIMPNDRTEYFTDHFNSVSEDSLISKGWILKYKEASWWNRRNEKPGHLVLYTNIGDNWPLGKNTAQIKNLLMREINSDCFTVEVHLSEFVPKENWQQAGILLLEDSTFKSRMIRFSIAYNDFFGGYKKQPEIAIAAVNSSVNGTQSKPEEIVNLPLFSVVSGKDSLVTFNLKTAALKIEKKGDHFRFLYIVSPFESFAFKEASGCDLNIQPKYVGIFAIQGWADTAKIIPACFDSFVFMGIACDK